MRPVHQDRQVLDEGVIKMDFSDLYWFGLGILSLGMLVIIAGHLNRICDRLTGLMLAVQELCDRIWDLRDEG